VSGSSFIACGIVEMAEGTIIAYAAVVECPSASWIELLATVLHLAAERGKIRPRPQTVTIHFSRPSLPMSSPTRPAESASLATANPVLCASAASRVIWAAGALVVLWTTVLWALD
jgi:hypothetical protein